MASIARRSLRPLRAKSGSTSWEISSDVSATNRRMAGEVRNRRGRLTGNPGKVIRQFNFEGALGPTKTFIGKTGWIQLDLLGFLHVISLDFTGGGEMHVFGT